MYNNNLRADDSVIRLWLGAGIRTNVTIAHSRVAQLNILLYHFRSNLNLCATRWLNTCSDTLAVLYNGKIIEKKKTTKNIILCLRILISSKRRDTLQALLAPSHTADTLVRHKRMVHTISNCRVTWFRIGLRYGFGLVCRPSGKTWCWFRSRPGFVRRPRNGKHE